MRSHLDRPGIVCAAAVSLLTAVAVIAPSPARGDDTLQPQLPSVGAVAEAVTAATADALPAVQTDVPPAVDVVTGLEPAPASDPAVEPEPAAAPSDPALTPAPTAENTPEATAESAEPALVKASPTDITTPPSDIEADTPPPAPTPVSSARTSAPTPATATVAANINVSVRIGSAGDNGPVTQVNVDAPTTRPLSMDVDDTPDARPAEQPSLPAGGGTAHDSAPTDSSDTWYWNWDCLSAVPVPAISPGASGTDSFPTSWTWIWNCGGNDQQYQTETVTGYQQINTNIAIRFSSPGNDGEVTQVNLGAGLTVALPAPIEDRTFVPTPLVVPAAVDTILDALPALAEPVLTPVAAGDTTDTSAPLAPSAAPVAPPSAATPGAVFALPPRAVGEPVPVGGWWVYGAPSQGAPSPTAASYPTAPFEQQSAWSAVAPAQATAAAPREPARPAEAAPRQRPPLPDRAPAVSASGVSAAAAAGGGGSSGSGLPALLMLPFVAALLDLARRVALEHATWPTGHRRRAPDRPG